MLIQDMTDQQLRDRAFVYLRSKGIGGVTPVAGVTNNPSPGAGGVPNKLAVENVRIERFPPPSLRVLVAIDYTVSNSIESFGVTTITIPGSQFEPGNP